MATRGKSKDQEKQGADAQEKEARELLTPPTPKLETLKVGLRVVRRYKGEEYHGEVIDQEGARRLRVTHGKKVIGIAPSLSKGAELVSNHPERGGAVWFEVGKDVPLIGMRPRYDLAASPGPKRSAKKATRKATPRKATRARKPKNGSGASGTGTVKQSWLCQQGHKHPTQAEATDCTLKS